MKRSFRPVLYWLLPLIVVLLVLVLRFFILSIELIERKDSETGERLRIYCLLLKNTTKDRGDRVLFQLKGRQNTMMGLVKYLPKESLTYRDWKINNERDSINHLKHCDSVAYKLTLGAEKYWIVSDSLLKSEDSHVLGPIDEDCLLGICIYSISL